MDISFSFSLLLLPGGRKQHRLSLGPRPVPHAQTSRSGRFPLVFGRMCLERSWVYRSGDYLPRRICTSSGKVFPSLTTCSQTGLSTSFPVLGGRTSRKCVAVKNMLKLTASIYLLHTDDTPLEVSQSSGVLAVGSGPATQTPVPNSSPPPSVSRVLGPGG